MTDFNVRMPNDGDPFRPIGANADDYIVHLPHQCDEWLITATPNKEQALDELYQFRDELDEAIRKIEDS